MSAQSDFNDAFAGPADLMSLFVDIAYLAGDTQSVMAMRMLGMSGLWNVKRTENTRMVAEKPAAFARSAEAAMHAAVQGRRPDQVMSAAIEPLRSKTRANAARLSRRGPGMSR